MSRDENILITILLWLPRQIGGWLKNFGAVVGKYKPTDFIPPAISSTLGWLKEQVPQALGFGTPGEQMSSSVVLAGASIATSVFTGGVTVAFVLLFAVTFIGGALRLWPFIDRIWPFGQEETR